MDAIRDAKERVEREGGEWEVWESLRPDGLPAYYVRRYDDRHGLPDNAKMVFSWDDEPMFRNEM